MTKFSRIVQIIFFTLWLTAATSCQFTESASSVKPTDQAPQTPEQGQEDEFDSATEQAPTTEALTPDPALIPNIWQSGPHANTFVMTDSGKNSTCARCHAPVNWIPALDDMPESCFTCKFEIDPPPPKIAENDWIDIPCNVCHEVDKRDNVQAEYVWLEIAQIEVYADVATTTELCQKCHIEINLPDHEVAQLGGAHTDYQCTDCHDAHNTNASCGDVDCHDDVIDPATPITGHDADHQTIFCVACHDAADMEVGPVEDKPDKWTTFASTSSEAGGTLVALTSHNVVKEASCSRCHFDGNSWGLNNNVDKP